MWHVAGVSCDVFHRLFIQSLHPLNPRIQPWSRKNRQRKQREGSVTSACRDRWDRLRSRSRWDALRRYRSSTRAVRDTQDRVVGADDTFQSHTAGFSVLEFLQCSSRWMETRSRNSAGGKSAISTFYENKTASQHLIIKYKNQQNQTTLWALTFGRSVFFVKDIFYMIYLSQLTPPYDSYLAWCFHMIPLFHVIRLHDSSRDFSTWFIYFK